MGNTALVTIAGSGASSPVRDAKGLPTKLRNPSLRRGRLDSACGDGIATVYLRCIYGITPMCIGQVTDIAPLAKVILRPLGTASFLLTPRSEMRNPPY